MNNKIHRKRNKFRKKDIYIYIKIYTPTPTGKYQSKNTPTYIDIYTQRHTNKGMYTPRYT